MNPFSIKIDTEWAELDLFGHINNVAFFFYIQKARIKFCEHIGLTTLNELNKLGFMVASSKCDYKKPLFYPDQIQISLSVANIGNTSFQLSYEIKNSQLEVVANATDVLVVFDYEERSKKLITEDLRKKLIQYRE